ncbi:MAG TPA: tetratricopeptide repeat protein [Chitinophaga sp.]|uniref:tetratricopeptide repeat protein n=1 Tax=Chitinophaga sp. TaxID=1869181 RepID=UPI002DBE6F4A|nr:tetratricopeptide repeat protein [Chitinophaga sp.]HEU4554073.1 tetratricopeptide repeat protein [Chitinophaga sp.]
MRILVCFFCIAYGFAARAQTDTALANKKREAAIALMDEGRPAAALLVLDTAQKLAPDDPDIAYEMAYAHYQQKDYESAIAILKRLVKRKDATDRVYQMLGNSYDLTGKSSKAIATYEKGLKLFPNAGTLYLERGVMELGLKQYNKALAFFEAGIQADPQFPSNYYWAARLFFDSDEEVWAMIYGEIFINLERNTKRTEEISKLLYYTYKSEIKFKDDTSVTVSFSKQTAVNIFYDPKKGPASLAAQLENALKLPYGTGVYEPTLAVAVAGEKIVNLASLHNIRTKFLDAYTQLGHQQKEPVVLFDYQQQVRAAGHFEAYNYWVLGNGNQQEFEDWRMSNPQQWKNFVSWFTTHGLQVTQENKCYRSKY